jgi:hypothetical protein
MWDGYNHGAKAHHVAYNLYKGAVPSGLMLRHKCDVRSCVNPDHLEVGTALDNVTDAVSRDRHIRGERFHAAKLTERQVLAIRADPRARESQNTAIAKDYGITPQTVYSILKGRKWKHLLPTPK